MFRIKEVKEDDDAMLFKRKRPSEKKCCTRWNIRKGSDVASLFIFVQPHHVMTAETNTEQRSHGTFNDVFRKTNVLLVNARAGGLDTEEVSRALARYYNPS